MQVLIDISEKEYERIRHTTYYRRENAEDFIYHGTPLPKGHGRLIDADALKKKAVMCPTVGNAETLLLDISDVENSPTIIDADKEKWI